MIKFTDETAENRIRMLEQALAAAQLKIAELDGKLSQRDAFLTASLGGNDIGINLDTLSEEDGRTAFHNTSVMFDNECHLSAEITNLKQALAEAQARIVKQDHEIADLVFRAEHAEARANELHDKREGLIITFKLLEERLLADNAALLTFINKTTVPCTCTDTAPQWPNHDDGCPQLARDQITTADHPGAALLQELTALRAVAKYATHTKDCRTTDGENVCSCGLDALSGRE